MAIEQEKSRDKELQGEIEQLRQTLSFTQKEFRTQLLSNRDELNAANRQLQAVQELALAWNHATTAGRVIAAEQ